MALNVIFSWKTIKNHIHPFISSSCNTKWTKCTMMMIIFLSVSTVECRCLFVFCLLLRNSFEIRFISSFQVMNFNLRCSFYRYEQRERRGKFEWVRVISSPTQNGWERRQRKKKLTILSHLMWCLWDLSESKTASSKFFRPQYNFSHIFPLSVNCRHPSNKI